MHLVIVNQYGLPSGAPGITRHGDLGAELVRRGHTVTIIASRFNYLTRASTSLPGGSDTEDHQGVTFRWLATGRYRGNDRSRIVSMLRFAARATLLGVRLRPRPDVVIASSPHLLSLIPGLAIARRFRIPLVFEVRDLWPGALVDLGALRRGSPTHRVLEWLERRAYGWADRIITVPPHADRRVAEVGGDATRCVHVPNATALPETPSEPLPRSLSELLDGANASAVVMYTGAQGPSNGLLVVLDALDVLRERHPDVYAQLAIVLVGDGSEHERLVLEVRRREHRNVLFHPPIAKSSVLSALIRADILLVSFADAPVYSYGLSPNKLFDYLWAARPVLLATRLQDTPVTTSDAGRTFEPGSGSALAAAIIELLGLPDAERRAMGERGRSVAALQYTVPATADILEGMLLGLARQAA